MRVLVTAGATREYLDPVRFITNASSGRMGCAAAGAARDAGHEVCLLLGTGAMASAPYGVEVVRFESVEELSDGLRKRFPDCDALVMAAAVGDFRPAVRHADKMPRSGGPVTVELLPTEDLLAALKPLRRQGQTIVTFAVEDPPRDRAEKKAGKEMGAKGADYVVVNTPAAFAAGQSAACILSPDGIVLPWAERDKRELAEEVIGLLDRPLNGASPLP